MEQGFSIPGWVERFLRLVPHRVKWLLATGFLSVLLGVAVVTFLNFAAADDPLLQSAARYIKLSLMCFVSVVFLLVVVRALWSVIRPDDYGGKGDGRRN